MSNWVVMEARDRTNHFWAWCLVGGGPGIEQTVYTEMDGVTPMTVVDESSLRLGAALFTVPADDHEPREPRVVWTDEFDLPVDDAHDGSPTEEALRRMSGPGWKALIRPGTDPHPLPPWQVRVKPIRRFGRVVGRRVFVTVWEDTP